jgi:hypothetical protein
VSGAKEGAGIAGVPADRWPPGSKPGARSILAGRDRRPTE